MLNLDIKIGNLVADPDEVKEVGKNNTSMTKFRIGVNDFRQQEAEFYDIVVFGKQAPSVAQYLSKGRPVAVVGRDKKGSYENKEGNTVYTHEIIAERVVFISGTGGSNRSTEVDTSDGANEAPASSDDDDVPF